MLSVLAQKSYNLFASGFFFLMYIWVWWDEVKKKPSELTGESGMTGG